MENSLEDNIAFSFSVGGEDYVEESIYLARSLHQIYSQPTIVAGITLESLDKLNSEYIDELRNLTNLVEVEMSNKDYPISHKTSTMATASEIVEEDILVSVDTDLVVCDRIEKLIDETIEDYSGSGVLLKPANYGRGRHILGEKNEEKWKEIYGEFDLEFPGFIYESSYDNKKIPPYFHAALVISKTEGFPKKWDELSSKVYDFTGYRYSDQIALGMLSQTYNVSLFDDKFFWDPPSNLNSSGEEVVVHYNKLRQLTIVSSQKLQGIMNEINLDLCQEFPNKLDYRKQQLQAFDFYLGLNFPWFRRLSGAMKGILGKIRRTK